MISVEGSNMLRSLLPKCVSSPKTRALVNRNFLLCVDTLLPRLGTSDSHRTRRFDQPRTLTDSSHMRHGHRVYTDSQSERRGKAIGTMAKNSKRQSIQVKEPKWGLRKYNVRQLSRIFF